MKLEWTLTNNTAHTSYQGMTGVVYSRAEDFEWAVLVGRSKVDGGTCKFEFDAMNLVEHKLFELGSKI